MKIYGYARTSTVEQVAGLADQITKLKDAGCSDQSIYQEQISSVKMEGRVEFSRVLAALKGGDVLVFTSLSRAACSMIHMIEIEAKVARVGATIRILDLAINTATPSGRLTFNLFASIAQFEREYARASESRNCSSKRARRLFRPCTDCSGKKQPRFFSS